jgi:HYR domain-containing protein
MRASTVWNERLETAVWTLALLTGLLARLGSAQQLAPGDALGSLVLEGFVLEPDGDPAPGAVVVSSAGGKAVTDAAGSYRLELAWPGEAASVQVTAVGSRGTNTLASATVACGTVALGTAGALRLDPLRLTQGSSCSPSWLPTFGPDPAIDQNVGCLVAFDDGDGPALYVGGSFTSVGGVEASYVAKWDGARWSALGSGLSLPPRALAVFDDGDGPALYAGGGFTSAGGVAADHVAKWDGASWSALGSGRPNPVNALAVFDDGSGPALHAGAGTLFEGGVARWDGSDWIPLGSQMDARVSALAVFDDGSGPALYVGGDFTTAGGLAEASRIARWDGASWSALGSGVELPVAALAVFDDGGGAALYAGGSFLGASGVPANRVARWDGASWSSLGSGFANGTNGSVSALTVFDDGSGPALYAAGGFTGAGTALASRIARWDGASWSALDSGLESSVLALAAFDDGTGAALVAGGAFTSAGSLEVLHIAEWKSASWRTVGPGLHGDLASLEVFDDGAGAALYAAGPGLSTAGGVATTRIARWDGTSWTALGTGLNAEVYAQAVFDDGDGPALYAGGFFSSAGGVPASRIARWDGSSWSALGTGMGGTSPAVFALVPFDDGGGTELYAAGVFSVAGGVNANRIAKWNGSSWSTLGSGITHVNGIAQVLALAVFDDGTGPALYAAGDFNRAGGLIANRIAKWNGVSWSTLGSGTNGPVRALAVFDDGSGPALYAGGDFTGAGSAFARGIARWDGSSWTTLGVGVNSYVLSLAAFDDGSGPALFVGGSFTIAGFVAAKNIARWDGSSWSALGGGLSSISSANRVSALRVFDAGGGPMLYAGGSFTSADSGDAHLARWGCPDTVPPILSCPVSIVVPDGFADGPGEVVSFTITATDELDPAPIVTCVPPSGSRFPVGTTTVTCSATDASGNESTCEFPLTVQPKAKRR